MNKPVNIQLIANRWLRNQVRGWLDWMLRINSIDEYQNRLEWLQNLVQAIDQGTYLYSFKDGITDYEHFTIDEWWLNHQKWRRN